MCQILLFSLYSLTLTSLDRSLSISTNRTASTRQNLYLSNELSVAEAQLGLECG